jgi:hypothetical protein
MEVMGTFLQETSSYVYVPATFYSYDGSGNSGGIAGLSIFQNIFHLLDKTGFND